MTPIEIIPTRPDFYISFEQALNLRLPKENTGDWHFQTAFFVEDGKQHQGLIIAGPDGLVDTTPSLGAQGIRDMASVLASKNVCSDADPVYVANHYRAIADIAARQIDNNEYPLRVCNSVINQWLDTEEQVKTLKTDYLIPLRNQFDKAGREIFDQWIITIKYD